MNRAFLLFFVALACGGPSDRGDWPTGGGIGSDAADEADGAPTESSAGTSGGSGGGQEEGTSAPASESGDPLKLDVGAGSAASADDGGGQGCEKVDFLFLVDNSGSMQDEQDNLVAAFPMFMATIESTLAAQDYHIMAIDTDSLPNGGNCNGAPPSCCESYCAFDPFKLCGGQPCPGIDGCGVELGAGLTEDALGADCPIDGGQRYIADGQTDLANAFECIALVGTEGDGNELQMESVTRAVGPLAAPGQCNEGFLRDDAILVVTLITDEEDDPADAGDPDQGSPGGPQQWFDALVSAKKGDPSAIVLLGLVGDTDLPGAMCAPLSGEIGAEPAPRLRQLVEMFGDHGVWGSVCSPDYGPFFEQAVALIDTTCDEFEPEG